MFIIIKKNWAISVILSFLHLACVSGGAVTAIPAGRPANFEVQTVTSTPYNAESLTVLSTPVEAGAVLIEPLGDAPTHTPDLNQLPTRSPQPTATKTTSITATPTASTLPVLPVSPLATPTATRGATPVPAQPATTVAPPLQGGEWDFEGDFLAWANPYGEPCPGAAVAAGWTAFVEAGQFGSSCLNENLYAPNVFTGIKSQEITFDFIAANSGVFRSISTQPGHRYNIVAHAKHDRSLSPVEMFLGVDLGGGADWQAETVQWFPWDNATEDTWGITEESIVATGNGLTIFIRGRHPLAEQGGKTVIDNVIITDLGL